MKCPRCGPVDLAERERDAIVIDVCPQCRGVWLDRGELERLQARAVQEIESALHDRSWHEPARPRTEVAPPSPPLPRDQPVYAPARRRDDDDDDDDDDRRRHPRDDGRGAPAPRRRGWLSVFDVFD